MKQYITLLAFFLFAIISFTTLVMPQVQAQTTLADFNPFGSGGIKCIYFTTGTKAQDLPAGCTKDTGLLNRVESLLYLLAPAFAVIGIMFGGYKMMQDGYDAKGDGIKIIKGSIVGLLIVMSAFFIRDLVYTVLNGTFNQQGGQANTINNAGVQAILKLLRTVAYDFLVPIGTPIAVTFVILGGYQLITAGGNAKQIDRGISTIRNAILGFIVIVFAAAIISISQNLFAGLLGTIK
jgi:hypothetical protein